MSMFLRRAGTDVVLPGRSMRSRRITAAALCAAAFVPLSCSDEPAVEAAPSELSVAAGDSWKGQALADFKLIERSGREVTLADLRGRPALIDFIFTTCSGPCPMMSGRMQELQGELAGVDARFVSFTVDPETDTPEVLRAYAARFGADAERWWFLTGAEEQIDAVMASIWLARAENASAPNGMQVSHSTRFIALDARVAVRGYYDGDTAQGVRLAAARVRWLAEHLDQ